MAVQDQVQQCQSELKQPGNTKVTLTMPTQCLQAKHFCSEKQEEIYAAISAEQRSILKYVP